MCHLCCKSLGVILRKRLSFTCIPKGAPYLLPLVRCRVCRSVSLSEASCTVLGHLTSPLYKCCLRGHLQTHSFSSICGTFFKTEDVTAMWRPPFLKALLKHCTLWSPWEGSHFSSLMAHYSVLPLDCLALGLFVYASASSSITWACRGL